MKMISEQNVTPSQISSLEPNEVFVFGSNLEGKHYGGAAKFAVMRFGAEMGNPQGLQGQSYAIPTLETPGGGPMATKLPLSQIRQYVNEFADFAKSNPDMFFYVTPIGCGIAGFTEQEMAPLFQCCVGLDNVALPQSFIDVIGEGDEMVESRKKNKRTIKENKKMKKIIRLTEGDLHRIVKNSVKRILREEYEYGIKNDPSSTKGQFELGKLSRKWDDEHDNFRGGPNDIDEYARKARLKGARGDKKKFDTLYDYFCDGYEYGENESYMNNRDWDV